MIMKSKLKKLKMPESKKLLPKHDDDAQLEKDEEKYGMDLDNDHEEGEPEDHKMLVLGGDEDQHEPGMGDESDEHAEDGSMEDEEDGQEDGDDEMDEEHPEHEPLDLSALSDDELMAEMKKRGIMNQMNAKKPLMGKL